ncbi:MAG: hypothetical protein NTV06_07140 [candidate division Zixibacteria bacterium]|nr:hypothetical protein [candidate division Zixibacteria bacterium]
MLAILIILFIFKAYSLNARFLVSEYRYFIMVGLIAVILTILFSQFDPSQIHVGRFPAINEWNAKILKLEFPYGSSTNPSGFPFLFILAMPFYLLGDVGFLQSFSFVVFAFVLYLLWPNDMMKRIRCLILLLAAPPFMYEISVRSELFSNMSLIILFLTLLELHKDWGRPLHSAVFGFAGGLLLSTRGIVFLIYIIFLGFALRTKPLKRLIFVLSLIGGFLLTILPFAIWNFECFKSHGPFAIQISYIPIWLLVVATIISIVAAIKIRSLKQTYVATVLALGGVIMTVFVLSMVKNGLYNAVRGDEFDISYFCFVLPFLLIAWSLPEENWVS